MDHTAYNLSSWNTTMVEAECKASKVITNLREKSKVKAYLGSAADKSSAEAAAAAPCEGGFSAVTNCREVRLTEFSVGFYMLVGEISLGKIYL